MIRSTGRREAEVIKPVAHYMELCGYLVMRNNTGAFRPRPGRLVRFGLGRGSADLICCSRPTGQLVAVETKREAGGELSRWQIEWGSQLVANGGIYIVANSVDALRDALRQADQATSPRLSHQRLIITPNYRGPKRK